MKFKSDVRKQSRKTKCQNSRWQNRGKLHFNQEGLKVLGDAFLKEILIFLIDIILTKIQD